MIPDKKCSLENLLKAADSGPNSDVARRFRVLRRHGSFIGALNLLANDLGFMKLRFTTPLVCCFFLLAIAACGGPTSMGGFSEADATAKVVIHASADVCEEHQGNLVVEVVRLQINEYPNQHKDKHSQQPLLVRSFEKEKQKPRGGDVATWVSPYKYKSGATVDVMQGVRLVNHSLRSLKSWQLVIRVAENDRTGTPKWAKGIERATSVSSAAGALGVPAPSSSMLKEAIESVRKIDNDDLILLWRTDFETILKDLQQHPPGARIAAHSYQLATTRMSGGAVEVPAASLELLAYIEPVVGCR
jgi:hypothetical protein